MARIHRALLSVTDKTGIMEFARALTGLGAPDWTRMISDLAVPHQAQRDAELYIRRGGPPSRKPAGGELQAER